MRMLAALLVLVGSCATAQDTIPAPFHPNQPGHTWVIKGKALPWALLGIGVNYTLGMECGFGRMNSIGFTLTYDDYSFPNEVYDPATDTYGAGPRMYTVNRGAFINYRRYAHFPRWCARGFTPHFDAFVRYGMLHDHYQEGYVTNIVSHTELHYSAGVAFGVLVPIAGRLCLDASTGPFWKVKDIEQGVRGVDATINGRYTAQNFGWRLSANLYFWWRRKGH